ncbi:Low choriolytic enzyme [Channa argus]|uniref:Metalloendopeptidase n=1 Tax=Channa argus TaxID=215402 RepID=A0A6G1QJ17_CHAAH|nr:Low choriolytic enzyme [Channa argus]
MDLRTSVSLLLLLLLGVCNAQHGLDNVQDSGSPDFLLEGDVFVPRTRNAMKCLGIPYSCLWPKSADGTVQIPYVLDSAYVLLYKTVDNTDRTNFASAMNDMQSKTCIRFIPRATQTAYLSIEANFGCSSLMGYIGDKQVVSLQRYGCVSHGIIQHELLHALGFYHEHTRSDRDKYVKINWANIEDGYDVNFQLQNTNNLNVTYDYSSVMHYARTAFGKNGLETIIPTKNPSAVIGQRNGISDLDVLKVNKLYNCKK